MTEIRLDKFRRDNYGDLIAWIDTEETLMQFAGPLFKFPLTSMQLDNSLSDNKRFAFRIVNNQTNLPIGHSEVYLSENTAKLGRILIGDKEQRGKGLGKEIVRMLLEFVFSKTDKEIVELNVFDWNIGAIKCYEKVGFAINPHQKLERKVKDQTWIAVNMTIDKFSYQSINKTTANSALAQGRLDV